MNTDEYKYNQQNNIKRKKSLVVIWRVRIVQILVLLVLMVIFGRTFALQTFERDKLQAKSDQQKKYISPTSLFRGEIIDKNYELLALDVIRYNVYLRSNSYIKPKKEETYNKLLEVLGLEEEKFTELLESKTPVIKLKTNIKKNTAKELKLLKIKGLDILPDNKRIYPKNNLASHLLGFINWEDKGQSGIERSVQDNLHKQIKHKKKKQAIRRADGRLLYYSAGYRPVLQGAFGEKIQLTIDSKLQKNVEDILYKNILKNNAKKATAIVMETYSGEILAMANYPSYNPNNFTNYNYKTLDNWAITKQYEPGSTFKVLTVASALDSHTIKDTFEYMDNNVIQIGKTKIKNHDYKPGKEKLIDLVDLFAYSSNTGSAYIGTEMGAKTFTRYLDKFGIGQKTGIDLPFEISGNLPASGDITKLDLATTSFGQGKIAVTSIQMLSAFNTIANDGIWIQPHIVKGVYSSKENKLKQTFNPSHRRVISKRTAKKVSSLLAQAVRQNLEDDKGYIPGRDINNKEITIAGKTGTAQKYCPELKTYCPYSVMASFIGYLPSEQPEITILVVFDSPKNGRWGNVSAGPVFNQIANSWLDLYKNTNTAETKKDN